MTDPLTLIPNRREYDQHLLRETANARRSGDHLSILMLDINCFKSFNDNYGHHKGGIALARIATSLPRATDFVARFGGEEFVVILPQTDKQGAINVANHILAAVVKKRSSTNTLKQQRFLQLVLESIQAAIIIKS